MPFPSEHVLARDFEAGPGGCPGSVVEIPIRQAGVGAAVNWILGMAEFVRSGIFGVEGIRAILMHHRRKWARDKWAQTVGRLEPTPGWTCPPALELPGKGGAPLIGGMAGFEPAQVDQVTAAPGPTVQACGERLI